MFDDRKLKLVLIFVLLGGGLGAEPATAQSLVYLSDTNTTGASLSSMPIQILDIPITTGNNAGGYTLNSIALLMDTNSYAVGEVISAQLYDIGSDSVANYMIGNYLNNSVSAASSYNIFTPDSLDGDTSFLTPNTTYIIGFGCVGLNGGPAPLFNISFTSIQPTGLDGWSYGAGLDIGGPPIFDIVATPVSAVPEPNTLTLFGLAGLAACWRCRRK
jgi:hypothetical protein